MNLFVSFLMLFTYYQRNILYNKIKISSFLLLLYYSLFNIQSIIYILSFLIRIFE